MSTVTADISTSGALSMRVLSRTDNTKREALKWKIKNWIQYRWKEIPTYLTIGALSAVKKLFPNLGIMYAYCSVSMKIYRGDGSIVDLGIVGRHTIATAGKNYLAACFDNTNEPENFKYHGYGTGTNAAAAGDTALQTELTTEYVVNSTRPTGSQAHSSNTYTTVGTLSPDSGGTLAITEWGLFSASSSTTLWDRQVFSAVNLVASSDSLQTTYVLTIA